VRGAGIGGEERRRGGRGGEEATYGLVTPELFPDSGGEGRAAFVEGESVEGVLDTVT